MLLDITVIPRLPLISIIHAGRYPRQSGERKIAAIAWILLIIAGLTETVREIGLKYSGDGAGCGRAVG